MKTPARLFLTLALLFGGVCLAHARVWTILGTTKLEAEFSGVIGDTVFLTKTDGRSLKVHLSSLSAEDRAFIQSTKENTASIVSTAPLRPHPAATTSSSVIASLLAGKLVMPGSDGFVEYSPANSPDYYALYFSAGWCGPCHRFTPQLVEFYHKMKPQHGNFEVIFFSRDQSERDMLDYMHELSMPWPAVRFADLKKLPDIKKYMGAGIPCLVIIDPQGNVVADSFVNGHYVGAAKPMNTLGKLLEKTE